MANYRVSTAAGRDIRDIGRYTQEQWGAKQRRAYLDGLEQRFTMLTASPHIAPERREFDPPVRLYPYEKHLIIYRIERDGQILIIRVLHRNMDVPGRLSGT